MGLLTDLVRKYVLGFGIGEPSEESADLIGSKRKRPSDEEEEEDRHPEPSKNLLNSRPPFKKARMASGGSSSRDDDSVVEVKSPFRKITDSVKRWWSRGSRASTPMQLRAEDEVEDEGKEFVPNTSSSNLIETVDLVDDDDKENSPPPAAPLSSSSISTLATFGGFTARTDLVPGPGHGHVIATSHERHRRAEEAVSPEAVKAHIRSGLPSRFDRFHSEKDIAKRIWFGGVSKSKSGGKKNGSAFKFCEKLGDKERYRQMLNKFGVVKYPATTQRTDFLRIRSSGSKPGPVVPPVRVEDEVEAGPSTAEASMVTSTAIKATPQHKSSSNHRDLAASPMFGSPVIGSPIVLPSPSDKALTPLPFSATPGVDKHKSVLGEDDHELSSTIQEVTSPQYLEKLISKYGAVARDRERQIERERARLEKCEQETGEVFSMIDKRLESHLKITQAVLDESEKKVSEFDETQPTELPELTAEMNSEIRRAQRSRGETLVDAHKIRITVKDIDTLSGLNWLNDEIINFYMQMIVSRSETNKENFRPVYAFSTFFYPRLMDAGYSAVRRWTKKVDLFSYSLVLVPVHLGMHWCLAAVDMDAKSITYFDSMGGNNKAALAGLSNYLREEHKAKKEAELDLSGWNQIIAKKIPQQMNGSDCGMFTCKFAEYLSRRARFTFSQSNMPYFRKRMVYEICKNQIMHP